MVRGNLATPEGRRIREREREKARGRLERILDERLEKVDPTLRMDGVPEGTMVEENL